MSLFDVAVYVLSLTYQWLFLNCATHYVTQMAELWDPNLLSLQGNTGVLSCELTLKYLTVEMKVRRGIKEQDMQRNLEV